MELELLAQKRIEIMLDIAVKKFENEITALKHEVSNLKQNLAVANQEISSLRSHIGPISLLQVHNQNKTQNNTNDTSSGNAQSVQNAGKNSEQIRPRYGDYKSEDVSIEKFFYFGNKR